MAQPAPRGIMRIFCSGPGYEPRQRDFISNAKGAPIDACYRRRMGSRSWHAKGEAERPPAYEIFCPRRDCQNNHALPRRVARHGTKRVFRTIAMLQNILAVRSKTMAPFVSGVSTLPRMAEEPRSWKRGRRGESVGWVRATQDEAQVPQDFERERERPTSTNDWQ